MENKNDSANWIPAPGEDEEDTLDSVTGELGDIFGYAMLLILLLILIILTHYNI